MKDPAGNRIDAVLFDAVGTLFGLRRPVGELYGRRAARFGFPGANPETWTVLESRFHQAFRRRFPFPLPALAGQSTRRQERAWWEGLVREIFAGLGPFPRFDEFFDSLYGWFATAEPWELAPDCAKTLGRLRRRLKLAVVSNFDSRLDDVLESLGIADCFDAVIVPHRARATKPDPGIFRFALQVLGTRAERTLHVGDHPVEDYRAARRAGLQALLIDARPAGAGRIGGLAELSRLLV